MMQRGNRASFSSPEIARPSTSNSHHGPGSPRTNQDITFEGIGAHVKLLLKLIHEQSQMSNIDQDDRRTQRMAGMISILDDVKTRIQKCRNSPPTPKPVVKEFRRCNTELKPHRAPRDRRSSAASADVVVDEKDKLRREIHANCAARKSLEAMCSSLGKEKEIMASELSRKVQELHGLEELIDDLKTQNQTLLAKVQACALEHKDGGDHRQTNQGAVNAANLQDRNKALSEQLMKSLDGYRSLKRRYRDAAEENARIRNTIEEMGIEVAQGLARINALKRHLAMATTKIEKDVLDKEIASLEYLFRSFNIKISKHMQDRTTLNPN